MASLWFGVGNNWNPLLWRRQVLYKIPNQSEPSTHGSSQESVADVWPGICTLLHSERCNWRKKSWKLQRICLLLTDISFFILVIQGHYLFLLARQMKSCQWGLMRSFSYGLLQSSRWRTPTFWATKFWVFAGNFPFTGSNPSILKVEFFSSF